MSRRRLFALAGLAGALILVGLGAVVSGFFHGARSKRVHVHAVERERLVRRVGAEGVLAAVRSVPLSVPPGAPRPAIVAWTAADGSRVEQGEVVLRFDPTELERTRTDAEGTLTIAGLRRDRFDEETATRLSGLERDVEEAVLEEKVARRFDRRDEEIFSRQEIIESEIDRQLAERKRQHAEGSVDRERRLAATERQLLQIEQRSSETALERAESGLAALSVVTPSAGILLLETGRNGEPIRVGDSVWPGQKVAEIPDLDQLHAEVFVLEADAGALAAGRPATLRVDAFPEREYRARIERVASVARPRVRNSPVQYVAVILELVDSDPQRMRPGQRVTAELDLAAVEAALTVPLQAIFDRDGEPIVYRREGGRFVPVAVELGLRSLGRQEVVSGLAEGDVVALIDPTAGGDAAGPGDADEAETPVGPGPPPGARR